MSNGQFSANDTMKITCGPIVFEAREGSDGFYFAEFVTIRIGEAEAKVRANVLHDIAKAFVAANSGLR